MTIGTAATMHRIIRIELVRDSFSPTARARCSCGSWRQAGSYAPYSGDAGAIMLVTQRFDCGDGELRDFRVEHPFPDDPASVDQARQILERQQGALRSQAAALLARADEYAAAAEGLAR